MNVKVHNLIELQRREEMAKIFFKGRKITDDLDYPDTISVYIRQRRRQTLNKIKLKNL